MSSGPIGFEGLNPCKTEMNGERSGPIGFEGLNYCFDEINIEPPEPLGFEGLIPSKSELISGYQESPTLQKGEILDVLKGPDGRARWIDSRDQISRLPDNCLLKILRFLPRADLLNVETLSRRMNDVAGDPSLYPSKPLTFSAATFVHRFWEGHMFTLSTVDYLDYYPVKLKTFKYELHRGYKGHYWDKRTVRRGKRNVPYRERYREWKFGPIPPDLCKEMARMLLRYSASKIVISNLPKINDEFLTLLSKSLMKAKTTKIYIEYSSFAEGTLSGFKIFADLIKATTTDLTICHTPDFVEWGFLNENFFKLMFGSNLNKVRSLEDWSTYQAKKFFPSKSILPLLSQYDTLILPSLTLNADWIGEFIMMHLNHRKPDFTWSFWMVSVDRELTPYKIREQFASTDFTHDVVNGMHCVIKRSNGFKAHFHVVPIALDDRRTSFLYLLDINFSSADPKSYDRAYYRWFTQSHDERRKENVKLKRRKIRRTLGTVDTPKQFEHPLMHKEQWDEIPSPLRALSVEITVCKKEKFPSF